MLKVVLRMSLFAIYREKNFLREFLLFVRRVFGGKIVDFIKNKDSNFRKRHFIFIGVAKKKSPFLLITLLFFSERLSLFCSFR